MGRRDLRALVENMRLRLAPRRLHPLRSRHTQDSRHNLVVLFILCAVAVADAAPARPKIEPLTFWNEPGAANPVRPPETAPWPPRNPQSREAWAETAMLED